MRIIITISFVSVFIALLFFRGNIFKISEDALQPDLNPELINYLQGDWGVVNNDKTVLRIKRDSIFELRNDSIKSANSLKYEFNDVAGNYFKKDSSFVFSLQVESTSNTNEFKLKKINKNSRDENVYTLIYVSKNKMSFKLADSTVNLLRIK